MINQKDVLKAEFYDYINIVLNIKSETAKKTAERFFKGLEELTKDRTLEDEDYLFIVNSAIFPVPENTYEHTVFAKDISFFSICEHHLLPFFGEVRVMYQAMDKIVGLSKIDRLVEAVTRKPTLQEKVVSDILGYMYGSDLAPQWVAVTSKAVHFCKSARGPRSNSPTIVADFIGGVPEDIKIRFRLWNFPT